jgi:hypothetical protein
MIIKWTRNDLKDHSMCYSVLSLTLRCYKNLLSTPQLNTRKCMVGWFTLSSVSVPLQMSSASHTTCLSLINIRTSTDYFLWVAKETILSYDKLPANYLCRLWEKYKKPKSLGNRSRLQVCKPGSHPHRQFPGVSFQNNRVYSQSLSNLWVKTRKNPKDSIEGSAESRDGL